MKNVSIKVGIRKDKATKEGLCPVYYFIGKVTKGKTIKIPAKLSFHKNDWDSKLERPKNHLLNVNNQKYANYFKKIKSDFDSFICDLNTKEININEDVVKSFFRRKNGGGSHNCFYSFFEDFIQEAIIDKSLEKNTIKAYKSTLNVLRLFKIDLSFNDIDIDFIKKYDAFLKNKRGNKSGGLFNRHKHLRKLINAAILKGSMSRNPYIDFKIEKVKARVNYLSEENLKEMESLELNSIALERSKDMFLLSCYTGLRYGDIVNIKKNNIKVLGGKEHLVLIQQKTKKEVEILLTNNAKMIVEKYITDEENLLKLSNQKVNKNLKVIASRMKGINFNLTYHISRHTFATYLVNNGGDLYTVSKLLGHTSIKDTQIYAKVTSKSLIETIELFNK